MLRRPAALPPAPQECAKPKNQDKDLCRELNPIPGLPTAPAPRLRPALPTVAGPPPPRPARGPATGRAAADRGARGPTMSELTEVYDPALVSLLVPGMVSDDHRRPRSSCSSSPSSPWSASASSAPATRGWTGSPRPELHGGGALRRLRRRLRGRRGVLPRGAHRPGRPARCSPTTASTSLLDIDNEYDDIPADAPALVGNRSAVGEQYVELQPQSDSGPYLSDDSEIARDGHPTPIPTDTLLTHLDETVRSVDQDDLRDHRREFGPAFNDAGEDLRPILDSSNAFIAAADENFDVTVDLIRDSNTVPQRPDRLRERLPRASPGTCRRSPRRWPTTTGTCAGSSRTGSLGANELRVFLEDNEVELGELINNLVTTGEIVVKHLDGIEQLLVVYPYVVEGGFTVVSKSPGTGLYDAHFGMVLHPGPAVCHGYEGTDRRSPLDGSDRADERGRALHRAGPQTNARGTQNAPPGPAPATAPPGGRTTRRPAKLTGSEASRLERRRYVAPRSQSERRRGSGSISSPC